MKKTTNFKLFLITFFTLLINNAYSCSTSDITVHEAMFENGKKFFLTTSEQIGPDGKTEQISSIKFFSPNIKNIVGENNENISNCVVVSKSILEPTKINGNNYVNNVPYTEEYFKQGKVAVCKNERKIAFYFDKKIINNFHAYSENGIDDLNKCVRIFENENYDPEDEKNKMYDSLHILSKTDLRYEGQSPKGELFHIVEYFHFENKSE